MPIHYQFMTDDDKDDILVEALAMREQEWHNYQLNRENYESILASAAMQALPADWPQNLVKFKEVFGEKLAASVSDADYQTITSLQYRDRIRALLKTTITEQSKCESVHVALNNKKPNSQKVAAAVARLKQKGRM